MNKRFTKILKFALTILIAANLIDQIAGGLEKQTENFEKINKCLECLGDQQKINFLNLELQKLITEKTSWNPLKYVKVKTDGFHFYLFSIFEIYWLIKNL